MSYRVDIPTLSANEVYTLTFEYEGTETIQLIVGDLTLETTDRRVVFTTTSPVNYIKSNVNLTNLNIYEGYYESDDFGGEYTQESYIEGKSLINLMPASSPKTLSQGWSLDFDETTGVATIVFNNNTNNFSCSMRSFNMMKILKPATYYTYFVEILENSLVNGSGNKPVIAFYNLSGYMYPSTQCPYNVDTAKGDCVVGSGVERYTIKNEASPGKYVWAIKTVDTFVDTMVDADKIFQTVALNGTIKVRMMIVEGDYVDNPIETNWFPQGIGCVKSPTIISHEDSNNLFYIKDYTCTVNGGTVYSRNGKISFSGYFRTYTDIDIIKGGVWDGKPNCYYEPGTYYLKAHYKTIKPRPNNNTYTANFVFVCADGTTKELIGMPGVSMGGTFNTVQQDTLTVTSPIVKICYKVWYGGTRDWVTIENVSISKVNREYTQGEEDNVILETSVVSTPDDLKMYELPTKWGGSHDGDRLDLTTGILTKKIENLIIDNATWNPERHLGKVVPNSAGTHYECKISYAFLRDTKYNGASNNPQKGIFFKNGCSLPVRVEGQYISMDIPISMLSEATIDNYLAFLDGGEIIYFLGTHRTEQLSINALKSYRNGSITTSSQQLAPTLKTTLPVSNKFTTTNLTSGSTYNVYFDGTATKLDAGGTIITNPVSPCEVECGGTALTIEGTDIQNVRVIETSVKNEVGNNSTSDVELTKIVSYEHNNIASNVRYSKNSYVYQCSVKLDNTNHSFNISGGHASSHGSVNTDINYPSGISLVHIACDITMPSENLMANIHFGNGVWSGYQNFQNVTLNNDTATIKQTTQMFSIDNSYKDFFSTVVTGGHYSNLMYVVSKNNVQTDESFIITVFTMGGQTLEGYTGVGSNGVTISNLRVKVLENYPNITTLGNVTSVLRENDGSTIIWEDMDLTFIQNISDLEQPIKLRSLGTTYDSYNPVTGELIKRIGVSETDGSYSVLSSPIVMETRKTEVNGYMADKNTICKEYSKGYEFNTSGQLFVSDIGHYTDYYIKIPENTKTLSFKGMSYYKRIMIYDENKKFIKCYYTYDNYGDATGNITSDMKYVRLTTVNEGSQGRGYGDMRSYLVTDTNYLVFTSDTSLQTLTVPHLYTNGQVKVYSESEVYPTTILNGQSTNNYEVNELNTSNNYTIRYDGECESINLANKSNTQGTNRIVKSGATSGNLTFVNNSGDIDNVLLVQNDVREQEINHFYGLQTVEVNQLFISSKQNLFEAYMKNDFEFLNNVAWGAQAYGSLHNGVFKCGNLSAGENLQWGWSLTKPNVGGVVDVINTRWLEENPIVLANKVYNISFNISIVDHHTVDKNHNYNIRAYDFDGNEVSVQKATGGRAWLNIGSNGVTNPTPTNFINLDVIFSKDVYCFVLHADYGGGWAFDCTITDFTICEPENAKPDVPLVYEYIDLPQPVQLNRIHKENMPYVAWSNVLGQHVNLANGIAYDSYNPITGEYIQRVYKMTLNGDDGIKYIDNWSGVQYAINDSTLPYPRKARHADTTGRGAGLIDVYGVPYGASYNAQNDIFVTWLNLNAIVLNLPRKYTNNVFNQNACKQWLRENPITLYYELETPIVTQLTPINIPTFEGGVVQLITTDGKVFPMVEYSMPTNNRYDTSSWETGAVYTQRNMTEAYFNDSTTPMTPTETMTLTTDHISSGSIILNDNGNGLIVLKGNYTGRDIPYFTGMRSVEAIEVETTPSPDQPLFGKGGRK